MFGSCLGCVWKVFGVRDENSNPVSGRRMCMGCVWELSGNCLVLETRISNRQRGECVWGLLGCVWNVSGVRDENSNRVARRRMCLWYVWDLVGPCLALETRIPSRRLGECVCELSGVCLERTLCYRREFQHGGGAADVSVMRL